MAPIGPFRSVWAISAFFIIATQQGIGIVRDGDQPSTAVPHASMREAREWLADNGFVRS